MDVQFPFDDMNVRSSCVDMQVAKSSQGTLYFKLDVIIIQLLEMSGTVTAKLVNIKRKKKHPLKDNLSDFYL